MTQPDARLTNPDLTIETENFNEKLGSNFTLDSQDSILPIIDNMINIQTVPDTPNSNLKSAPNTTTSINTNFTLTSSIMDAEGHNMRCLKKLEELSKKIKEENDDEISKSGLNDEQIEEIKKSYTLLQGNTDLKGLNGGNGNHGEKNGSNSNGSIGSIDSTVNGSKSITSSKIMKKANTVTHLGKPEQSLSGDKKKSSVQGLISVLHEANQQRARSIVGGSGINGQLLSPGDRGNHNEHHNVETQQHRKLTETLLQNTLSNLNSKDMKIFKERLQDVKQQKKKSKVANSTDFDMNNLTAFNTSNVEKSSDSKKSKKSTTTAAAAKQKNSITSQSENQQSAVGKSFTTNAITSNGLPKKSKFSKKTISNKIDNLIYNINLPTFQSSDGPGEPGSGSHDSSSATSDVIDDRDSNLKEIIITDDNMDEIIDDFTEDRFLEQELNHLKIQTEIKQNVEESLQQLKTIQKNSNRQTSQRSDSQADTQSNKFVHRQIDSESGKLIYVLPERQSGTDEAQNNDSKLPTTIGSGETIDIDRYIQQKIANNTESNQIGNSTVFDRETAQGLNQQVPKLDLPGGNTSSSASTSMLQNQQTPSVSPTSLLILDYTNRMSAPINNNANGENKLPQVSIKPIQLPNMTNTTLSNNYSLSPQGKTQTQQQQQASSDTNTQQYQQAQGVNLFYHQSSESAKNKMSQVQDMNMKEFKSKLNRFSNNLDTLDYESNTSSNSFSDGEQEAVFDIDSRVEQAELNGVDTKILNTELETSHVPDRVLRRSEGQTELLQKANEILRRSEGQTELLQKANEIQTSSGLSGPGPGPATARLVETVVESSENNIKVQDLYTDVFSEWASSLNHEKGQQHYQAANGTTIVGNYDITDDSESDQIYTNSNNLNLDGNDQNTVVHPENTGHSFRLKNTNSKSSESSVTQTSSESSNNYNVETSETVLPMPINIIDTENLSDLNSQSLNSQSRFDAPRLFYTDTNYPVSDSASSSSDRQFNNKFKMKQAQEHCQIKASQLLKKIASGRECDDGREGVDIQDIDFLNDTNYYSNCSTSQGGTVGNGTVKQQTGTSNIKKNDNQNQKISKSPKRITNLKLPINQTDITLEMQNQRDSLSLAKSSAQKKTQLHKNGNSKNQKNKGQSENHIARDKSYESNLSDPNSRFGLNLPIKRPSTQGLSASLESSNSEISQHSDGDNYSDIGQSQSYENQDFENINNSNSCSKKTQVSDAIIVADASPQRSPERRTLSASPSRLNLRRFQSEAAALHHDDDNIDGEFGEMDEYLPNNLTLSSESYDKPIADVHESSEIRQCQIEISQQQQQWQQQQLPELQIGEDLGHTDKSNVMNDTKPPDVIINIMDSTDHSKKSVTETSELVNLVETVQTVTQQQDLTNTQTVLSASADQDSQVQLQKQYDMSLYQSELPLSSSELVSESTDNHDNQINPDYTGKDTVAVPVMIGTVTQKDESAAATVDNSSSVGSFIRSFFTPRVDEISNFNSARGINSARTENHNENNILDMNNSNINNGNCGLTATALSVNSVRTNLDYPGPLNMSSNNNNYVMYSARSGNNPGPQSARLSEALNKGLESLTRSAIGHSNNNDSSNLSLDSLAKTRFLPDADDNSGCEK